MAIKFNPKKVAGVMGSAIRKTAVKGIDVIQDAQQGAVGLYGKAVQDLNQRKINKYHAVFPDQLTEDFPLPNLIQIVDDSVRRNIPECKGSIGWLSNANGNEILHLYDEAVAISNIKFVPAPRCDSIYYVDSFNENRFISIDSIFSQAHAERLAELKHIAYSLGAIRCSIKISETNSTSQARRRKGNLGVAVPGKAGSMQGERSSASGAREERSGSIIATFKGSDRPQVPRLKWFANDDNINRLIEMRCNNLNGNNIISETVEIKGSSSATMSRKAAYSIDATVRKLGLKTSVSMESSAVHENMSKLTFTVEFSQIT